tara:strand:- start:3603 stop:5795 length:2193 start_codon:yes stop_codon:yes gene_type:complete
MPKPLIRAGGGLASILTTLRLGRESGGIIRLYNRMRTRTTCKSCALGMGGQQGGMVNEISHFPSICKKSIQAQAADMAGPITEALLHEYPITRLTKMTSFELERLGRLTFPIIARDGDTHFQRINWKETFDIAAKAFRKITPKEVFFYSSGRSSNEAGFLMQVIARAYGTENIHNCSSYCHNASSISLEKIYGSSTSSIVLADLQKADLVMIAGANPASNHPRLITELVKLRRRGGKVIVVNPLRELGLVRFRLPADWQSMLFGSDIANVYLQPHIGSDIALFKGLLKGLLELDGINHSYINEYTEGWKEVCDDIQHVSWNDLTKACGISRSDMEKVTRILMESKRGIFCWTMGLTQHTHGVDNIFALANLALARGWIGKTGCGLLPLRGHSNVQGIGSVGVTPSLKEAFAEKMRKSYNIPLQKGNGLDTFQSMEAASAGQIKAAFLLGGNLLASNPDRTWAEQALQNIPLTIHVSTKLNEGHVHGRGQMCLILPALTRDEEHHATTQESMFNFVRLSEGGTPTIAGEQRSEVDIITSLAESILPANRFEWSALRSHKQLRHAIAQIVPGYKPIHDIDHTHQEFQVKGRTFHTPQFATSTGKASFHVTPLPSFAPAQNEFRLMTVRSENQFNTVVYDHNDLYRGNTRRDVLMMATTDAQALGVTEGDPLVIETSTGHLTVACSVVDIPAGNLAMYYPEANILVPRNVDTQSGTPAFKSITARLWPIGKNR